ncbi:Zinc finger GATA-type [Arabidopsis suecica]|uniref:Zinc finger GATA-type n=1 Tax=Arabidopsis suecica TaxID=45249 RepID=A0A8T1ZUL7_ARASU|nr:Zinc finger GATA-type [Arabidopsis suecica]
MLGREDVLVDEEEDFGTAMQQLPIPVNELGKLPTDLDSVYGFADEFREIIEDSNLLLEDSREFDDLNHNKFIDVSNDSKPSNLPTATKGRFHGPKRSRNKRGRQKRLNFKSPSDLFDSKFGIADKSCSHCGTRKTPLWREGPRGAGTLCNACGMRYRTGRLLPEYRPASSPDFKPNVHSNFHRKVMEIRSERNSTPNSASE